MHVRLETDVENEAVPDWAPRVDVAMTEERSEAVPYAKPDWVASAPPVTVIDPFKVADVWPTDEAADVDRVGAGTARVVVETIDPYAVPAPFVAYART